MSRGWCGIGIVNGKNSVNIGTLWRTASVLNVDFVFTVARRYKHQSSDTMETTKHIPLWHFDTLNSLLASLPSGGVLVGVELDESAIDLAEFAHPERALYLLGAEDHGLTQEAMQHCHQLVRLRGERSLNVSTAGSIVLHDRAVRGTSRVFPIPRAIAVAS